MIWPTDALRLAATKLKTRKIRLVITLFVTSLLFGVLILISSLTEGVVRSLKSFGQEGYGNKYLVQASPLTYQYAPETQQEIASSLSGVQRDLIARKKAAAKKLNLTYDETSDQNLPLNVSKDPSGGTEIFPNFQSKYVNDLLEEKNNSIPGTRYEEFVKTAKAAGATDTYRGTLSGMFMIGSEASSGRVTVILNGKEDIASQNTASPYGIPDNTGVKSIASLGWRSADAVLLVPFVLPGQTLGLGADGSIPIIAPFSAAEEIMGLKPLPETATSKEKLERLTVVRKSVAGKTADLCYRSASSDRLLSEATQQQKEIQANKNKKDYTLPPLRYSLPAAACGPTAIFSDKRSDDEKKLAANQKLFDKEFSQLEEPVEGILKIRSVGLNPDMKFDPSLSPTAVLSYLFTSSSGTGWISPAHAIEASQLATKIQGGTAQTAPKARVIYYAQFKDFQSMKNFISGQECDSMQQIKAPDGTTMAVNAGGQESYIDKCIKQGRVLSVSPYGNSAGAIEQFRSGIWKFVRYAVVGIVILASLIMMGNIGKIIADSRRETAVFRSLGAKRIDIAQIYLTYTLLVSLLVAGLAMVLGSVVALYVSSRYSDELTITAILASNATDTSRTFSMYGINPLYILAIFGLIIITGILSAGLPLLTNTRRNPIRDMRDEG